MNSVLRTKVGNVEVVLVGTAHVLKESVEMVRETIREEMPEVVALELDMKRFSSLYESRDVSLKEVIKQGKFMVFLVSVILSYVQRKIGAEIGVEPGAEMKEAVKTAKEIGARTALIDQELETTLSRFLKTLSLREKLRLLLSILGVFRGKVEVDEGITDEEKVNELLEELKEISPSAYKVFVEERNVVMANRIREIASSMENGKIVAVMGAGHVNGVRELLTTPMNHLTEHHQAYHEAKYRGILTKIIGAIIGFLVIFMFILILKNSFEGFLTAFMWWFIINGALSAIGAAIAGGHPLSILTAFSVAWMTSLSPFLAAGWFAGLVELWKREPTVADVRMLFKANSLSEMRKNRAFKVLMVAALSNVGSVIGTFIGAYLLFKMV